MIGKYSISEDGYKKIVKSSIPKRLIFYLVIVCFGIGVSYFQTKGEGDVNVLPFILPFITVIIFLGSRRGMKRAKGILKSYSLTIYEDSILRQQDNTPDIEIAYDEIQEIIHNVNGSLTIKGDSIINSIGVPAQIENFEEVYTILNAIKPITKTKNILSHPYANLFALPLVLGPMLIIYMVDNKIIVGICGAIFMAFMGYSYYVIQNSKNIDQKTKSSMRILGFVMACMLLGIIAKLLKP